MTPTLLILALASIPQTGEQVNHADKVVLFDLWSREPGWEQHVQTMAICFRYGEQKTGISYSYCVRDFYVRGDTLTIFDDSGVKYVVKAKVMGRTATYYYPHLFYQDSIPQAQAIQLSADAITTEREAMK